MRYIFYFIALFIPLMSFSQNPGDTTVVQAFTFGSPQDAEIEFPSEEKQYEKILMLYTLRCVPGGAGGLEYPCGEWDYLSYTYLFEPTGIMDSTRFEQANFLVNRTTQDDFDYQETPLYDVIERTDNVLSSSDYSGETLNSFGQNTASIGIDGTETGYFHTQFMLTNAELSSILGGSTSIKGIAFESNDEGIDFDRISINMMNTSEDALTTPIPLENATLCFAKAHQLENGINRFHFDNNFEWDGTSSVIVDVVFNGTNAADFSFELQADDAHSSMSKGGKDGYLSFNGGDIVDFDGAQDIFSSIDEEITISFWCYGDPDQQPVNNSIIEGVDKNGNRVLNIHMPWSNGQIYWDAGIDQGNNYDRINKLASPTRFEGAWNHYAFTKNTATGEMKIYQNGSLWHSGQNMNRSMANVVEFRLGSMANDNNYYRGYLDEFRVWSKELSESDIADWMYKSVDQSHPAYQDLQVYMDFNEDEYIVKNQVGATAIGERFGIPNYGVKQSGELSIGYNETSRPFIHLLTDDYNLDVSEDIVVRSNVYREPVALELFMDPDTPERRTELKYVWPAEETYVYDIFGSQIGVNQSPANDQSISLSYTPYFSDPFEVIERFEVGRYITPYGIGLDLGEGWTWVFDVTDYMPLLRGNKRMTAGNWQELLDLKFLFIEGTPARDVLGIRNLHSGGVNYRNSIDANEALQPDTVQFLAETEQAKLKVRNSGHGFGGNLNCSEFCPRNNQILINGTTQFSQYLWRDDCASNPLYPQGGTWVYDRANWCPGAEVNSDDYELAGVVDFDTETVIDYYLEDGYTWNGSGSTPYYQIESQLVEYGPFNHTMDLAVEEILAPNKEEIYLRNNPMCGQPIVKFMNRGENTINQFKVDYGIAGILNKTTEFDNLNVEFGEEITLDLPALANGTWPESDDLLFYVEITEVNNGADSYELNNRATVEYEEAARLNSSYVGFIAEVRTNNNGNETSYSITDAEGNEILNRSGLASNTTYRDTIYTEEGCYNFTIFDSGEDGLQWWANAAQGAGYANIRGLIQQGFGVTFRGIDPDFGALSRISFTAGEPVTSNEEYLEDAWGFDLLPNPISNYFEIRMDKIVLQPVDITIHNHAGQEVLHDVRSFDTVLTFENVELVDGLYFITVQQGNNQSVKKLIVQH